MSLQIPFHSKRYGNCTCGHELSRLLQMVTSLSTCNFLRELLSGSSNKEKQQYYGVVNVVTCVSFPATCFGQDPIVAGHNR